LEVNRWIKDFNRYETGTADWNLKFTETETIVQENIQVVRQNHVYSAFKGITNSHAVRDYCTYCNSLWDRKYSINGSSREKV
jgi:hypothetical protein